MQQGVRDFRDGMAATAVWPRRPCGGARFYRLISARGPCYSSHPPHAGSPLEGFSPSTWVAFDRVMVVKVGGGGGGGVTSRHVWAYGRAAQCEAWGWMDGRQTVGGSKMSSGGADVSKCLVPPPPPLQDTYMGGVRTFLSQADAHLYRKMLYAQVGAVLVGGRRAPHPKHTCTEHNRCVGHPRWGELHCTPLPPPPPSPAKRHVSFATPTPAHLPARSTACRRPRPASRCPASSPSSASAPTAASSTNRSSCRCWQSSGRCAAPLLRCPAWRAPAAQLGVPLCGTPVAVGQPLLACGARACLRCASCCCAGAAGLPC